MEQTHRTPLERDAYDALCVVPTTGVRVFDAGIVAVPLLLVSRPALRWFGLRMMGSVVASAALLASLLPLCVVRLLPRPIIPDTAAICRLV